MRHLLRISITKKTSRAESMKWNICCVLCQSNYYQKNEKWLSYSQSYYLEAVDLNDKNWQSLFYEWTAAAGCEMKSLSKLWLEQLVSPLITEPCGWPMKPTAVVITQCSTRWLSSLYHLTNLYVLAIKKKISVHQVNISLIYLPVNLSTDSILYNNLFMFQFSMKTRWRASIAKREENLVSVSNSAIATITQTFGSDTSTLVDLTDKILSSHLRLSVYLMFCNTK